MYTSFNLIISILLGVLALGWAVLLVLVLMLYKRLRLLTRGTDGKNLETALHQLAKDHTIFEKRVERGEEKIARLDAEMMTALRGIATIRYNAFSDVGGKQSFATALLSADGNGVIISSIYTRERVNVYAKPIVQFVSEYELSQEETRALKEAGSMLP